MAPDTLGPECRKNLVNVYESCVATLNLDRISSLNNQGIFHSIA